MTQIDSQQACCKWVAARSMKDDFLGHRDEQPEIETQLSLLTENLQRLEKDLGSRLHRLLDEANDEFEKQKHSIDEARVALAAIFSAQAETPNNAAANFRASKNIDQQIQHLSRRMRPRILRALNKLAPEYRTLEKPLSELTSLRMHCAKPVAKYHWVLRSRKKGIEISGRTLHEIVVEPLLDEFCQSSSLLLWRYQAMKWRCHREFNFTHLPVGEIVFECLTERSELDADGLIEEHLVIHEELKDRLVSAWQSIRFNLETASSELNDISEDLRSGKMLEIEGRGSEISSMVTDALDKCLQAVEEVPVSYTAFIDATLEKLRLDHEKLMTLIHHGIENPNAIGARIRWRMQALKRSWLKRFDTYRDFARGNINTLRESPTQLGRLGKFNYSMVGRFRKETPIKEALLKLTDIPSESELLEQAKVLPPIYRRLFQNEPLYNREFMVGMDDELLLLDETYARWCTGKASSVAVVGPEGSGKTSLMHCFANELDEDVAQVQSTIHHRLETATDVVGMLDDVLEIETPSDTAADLIGKIMKMERRVVLIEDGHQLFLRTVGARTALDTFFFILMSTRTQFFWVLTFRLNPWLRISYLHQAERYFTHVIKSEFHSENELREAILLRQRMARQSPVFSADEVTSYKVRKLIAQHDVQEKPVQQALADLYFTNLYALSGGNMQTALYYWLRSLSVDEQGDVQVNPCIKVDTSFIKSLDTLYLLTLTEVLAHGGMTPREHSEIFNLSDLRSRLILDYLRQIRLLKGSNEDRRGQPQSYIVNPIFYQPVSSTLTAMHYLY